MHILVKDDPHHSGLSFVDNQLENLVLALVVAPASYKIVTIGSKATFEAAVLDELTQSGFGTDGSLFTFAVRLPETDIVGELTTISTRTKHLLLIATIPLLRLNPDSIVKNHKAGGSNLPLTM